MLNDTLNEYKKDLNEIVISKLNLIELEEQIVQMIIQTLISKINLSSDYMVNNDIILILGDIIKYYYKTGDQKYFCVSFLALQLLLSYISKERINLITKNQAEIIKNILAFLEDKEDDYIFLHTLLNGLF